MLSHVNVPIMKFDSIVSNSVFFIKYQVLFGMRCPNPCDKVHLSHVFYYFRESAILQYVKSSYIVQVNALQVSFMIHGLL